MVNSIRMFFMSVFALFTCCSVTTPQKPQATTPDGHRLSTSFSVNVFRVPTQSPVAKYDVLMEGTKLPSPDGFFCEIEGSRTSKTGAFGSIRCTVITNVGIVMGTAAEVSCRQDAPDAHDSSFTLFSSTHRYRTTLYTYHVACTTK